MKFITLIIVVFVGCTAKIYLDDGAQLQPITNRTIRLSEVDENGIPGLPGLEFRINPKGFSYASFLVGLIVDQEVRRVRFPSSRQCFQHLNGCITIDNYIITRYRCPQLIRFYPEPLNRLILNIQNLDIEIKANIHGEIKNVLPIKINNTVYTRVNQVSAIVHFTVNRKANGSPYLRAVGCHVSLGFSDIFLEDTDVFADIFNKNFRGNVTAQIRKQFPIRVCQMIRYIVAQKINLPLSTMSKIIPLNNLTDFAKQTINSIKLGNLPQHCYSPMCNEEMKKPGQMNDFSSVATNLQISHAKNTNRGNDKVIRGTDERVTLAPLISQINIAQTNTSNSIVDKCADCYSSNISMILPDIVLDMHVVKAFATPDYFQVGLRATFTREETTDTPFHPLPMHIPKPENGTEKRMLDVLISDYTINSFLYHLHKNGLIMFGVGPETPKFGHLLKTTCTDDEDYDQYDDFSGFKADDEFDSENNSTKIFLKRQKRQKRHAANVDNNDYNNDNDDDDDDDGDKKTMKDDEDFFGDLGICLGDIMPAVREKYPRKLLHVKFQSRRTPHLTLLAQENGIARIDLELELALYIDDSGERIGTVLIRSTIDGSIQISNNQIFVLIKIQSLKLIDEDETLGLPPDALENLANLSRDLIDQTANNQLSKGFNVDLTTGKIPFHLVKPKFSIINHAVRISADFNIPPSILGVTTSSNNCRHF